MADRPVLSQRKCMLRAIHRRKRPAELFPFLIVMLKLVRDVFTSGRRESPRVGAGRLFPR